LIAASILRQTCSNHGFGVAFADDDCICPGAQLASDVDRVSDLDHLGVSTGTRERIKELFQALNPPTSTLLVVAGLASPDYMVEIEAIAVVRLTVRGAERSMKIGIVSDIHAQPEAFAPHAGRYALSGTWCCALGM